MPGLAVSCLQRSVTERPDSSAALPEDTLSPGHNTKGVIGRRPSETRRPPPDAEKEPGDKEASNKRPVLN